MEDSFDLAHLNEPAAPAAMSPAPYLDGLNDSQREAVETTEGPVLVLAGAGTGKTRALTTRLAHLIHTGRARPYQILAVTFTNKAAREMRDRVERLVGPAAQDIRLGTFHSIGVWMLRRRAELVGLQSNFTILDTDDQIRLLKQVIQNAGVDEKKWTPKALAAIVNRWKDKGLGPERLSDDDAGSFANGKAVALYADYQSRLLALNACDFGDLLLHPLNLLQKNPELLADYQTRFRYILVDEYQDTNVSQYLWLRLLAQKHRNICCVGDDDQSIYGWRGAEVDNILRFEKDFEGAKVIRLERNYRSTPHILAAASSLIAHNEGRLGKTLWTDTAEGEKVSLKGVWDGEEEARAVAEEIEALQRSGESLDEIAILVRAGSQTRDFEERFLQLGIPYRIVGGLRFYNRAVIRDAVAYLRMVAQSDDALAFERIVNLPKRGLGNTTIQKLHQAAVGANISLPRAARAMVETDELRAAARKSLADLLDKFDRWRSLIEVMPPAELAETVMEESGYVAMWQADKSPEAEGKLEDLRELFRAIEEFETLPAFLEHVSLVTEREEDTQGEEVSLMTLHAAKGLEFDSVFLPGWEEGLFPNQRALDETGLRGLEEERRLAHVGITRARKRCYISYAANRRMHGQWLNSLPSRFIEELPPEHVEMESESGLYGNAYGGRDGYGSGHGGLRESASHFDHGGQAQRPPSSARNYLGAYQASNKARIDNLARHSVPSPEGGFKVGMYVIHQKFGRGRILGVEGNKLAINFDSAGLKKVMESFVEPE